MTHFSIGSTNCSSSSSATVLIPPAPIQHTPPPIQVTQPISVPQPVLVTQPASVPQPPIPPSPVSPISAPQSPNALDIDTDEQNVGPVVHDFL
jgi:hypothetical protein